MTCRWNAKLSDSFSDLFGRYVPAHIEGGFVPLYCCYSRHCPFHVETVVALARVEK